MLTTTLYFVSQKLSFLNIKLRQKNILHFVLNLSPVAGSYSCAWVKSVPVRKKPEIDVYYSESVLNILNTTQQSENAKFLKELVNVKLGSKYKNIQWNNNKNKNSRFIAGKSASDSDICILVNSETLKNFSEDKNTFHLINLENKGKYGEQQKKILATVEFQLHKKSTWGETYTSKSNFEENKKTSCSNHVSSTQFSKTSPIFSSIVGTINSYSESPFMFKIQKRGFKSKRAIKLEEQENPSKVPKLNDWFGKKIFKSTAKDKDEALKIITEQSASPEEKYKMQMSFTEGYMLATRDQARPSFGSSAVRFISSILLGTFLIFGAMVLFSSKGIGNMFKFSFVSRHEINPENVDVTFSDVKGVDEAKEELREVVEFLKNPSKFTTVGGKLPKGLLLVGPPGTGKTLLARAVAGEAGVPFFHASGAEFDEIFVGEGARRVRHLFLTAKAKAPCIIFIDEIDAVGAKRKVAITHPHSNQTINQLLSEMDGFSKNEGVIVIGATNRKSDLDPALLRPGRFDVEVMVQNPDFKGRKEILELYLSRILSKNIDIDKIAKVTVGCSGAVLEAIVNHAAIRAAAAGLPYVTTEVLEESMDKILMGPERKSAVRSQEEDLMTAYHESGHAIVAYFTEGANVIRKVTIVPRGQALGSLSSFPEFEQQQPTKAKFLAEMDVALGGRAAEELIFGESKITAGASSDLEKATKIAASMIKDFGMSDKLGLRTLRNSENDWLGPSIRDQIDVEVKRLVQESYERSKNLLKKYAKEHKLLAEALLKYKTLHLEDVRAILGDNSHSKKSSRENLSSVAN